MSFEFKAAAYEAAIQNWLVKADRLNWIQRLWDKDASLWKKEAAVQKEIRERLGWLDLPVAMQQKTGEILAFADEIKNEGCRHLLLMGMGGSSLAPEVFQSLLGNRPGYPELFVLDSTDPAHIADLEKRLDLDKTLFIVSSKSGGTLELVSFFKYFFEKIKARRSDPGRQFIAITDPGTTLAASAAQDGFRRIFLSQPNVGGRFSALTFFGLVPAALIGVDVEAVLKSAAQMADASRAAAGRNPSAVLGVAMAVLAEEGRDKLTLLMPEPIASFGDWVEQLVAESTGKEGAGILPVVREPLAEPGVYGSDRFFAALVPDTAKKEMMPRLEALEKKGHPLWISRFEPADLGAEFFRWEMATAIASSLFKINAFDQPDVQAAKDKAKALLKKAESGEKLALPASELSLEAFWRETEEGDYVAILAFLPAFQFVKEKLRRLAVQIRGLTRLATTVGLGPRYLHSTGQLHKGGANRALYLLLTTAHDADLSVPGEAYTFGQLELAQAMGDYEALAAKGRWLVRVRLDRFSEEALEAACKKIKDALLETRKETATK